MKNSQKFRKMKAGMLKRQTTIGARTIDRPSTDISAKLPHLFSPPPLERRPGIGASPKKIRPKSPSKSKSKSKKVTFHPNTKKKGGKKRKTQKRRKMR